MKLHSIHKAIFAPRSIVVVGASDDTSKVGGRILKNIRASEFAGRLYGIHPKADSVQGVPCPPLKELPSVELAILAVPSRFIEEYVSLLCREKQTKGFIILSAGFAELDEAGKELQERVLKLIEEHGGSLIGPNCTGVLTPAYSGIFAGPLPKLAPSGCAMVSGSGAAAAFIVEQGIEAGLPFSEIITVGNSAQIGVEEVLAHWDAEADAELDDEADAELDSGAEVELDDEADTELDAETEVELETASGQFRKPLLLYIESIRYPQAFLEHARSLRAKGFPLCAVKAGSSEAGSRAAASHTGAMTSPDHFIDALFRKAGIIRCAGRQDLITAASILRYPPLKGQRIAVVTHAGGPGVMLTDELSRQGFSIPQLSAETRTFLLKQLHPGSSAGNPIDFLATGTADQLDIILQTLRFQHSPGGHPEKPASAGGASKTKTSADTAAAWECDGICVIFGSPGMTSVEDVYTLLIHHISQSNIPIYPILPSPITAGKEMELFRQAGYPFFTDEQQFARILGLSFRDSGSISNVPRNRIDEFNEPLSTAEASAGSASAPSSSSIRSLREKVHHITAEAPSFSHGFLNLDDARKVIAAAGIPIPEGEKLSPILQNDKDSIRAARAAVSALTQKLPFPWAIKAVGPLHKSDVGGVAVGIEDAEEALREAMRISAIPETSALLIHHMAEGTEFFCGITQDPRFGHLLVVGLGGVYVEILRDTASELLPLSRESAQAMIRKLKSYPLIAGIRGKAPLDEARMADTLVKLSDLISAVPEITEMDINPLFVSSSGVSAADVRIRMAAFYELRIKR